MIQYDSYFSNGLKAPTSKKRTGCCKDMKHNITQWHVARLLMDKKKQTPANYPTILASRVLIRLMEEILHQWICSWSTTPFQPWHEVHFFVVSVWGGVGMLPFLELAHMVDATSATSSLGFGVGWGRYRSLNLHTWSMLRLLRLLLGLPFLVQRRSSSPGFWNTEFSCCLKKVVFFQANPGHGWCKSTTAK